MRIAEYSCEVLDIVTMLILTDRKKLCSLRLLESSLGWQLLPSWFLCTCLLPRADEKSYPVFLWPVEFWLAKNLLLTLHGSRAVYFIWHRKSIIAVTYCLCCVFHTAQKINNRSLTFFQRYTYLCFSYNKDIVINVGTFR